MSKLILDHLINKFNKNTLKIKPSSLILIVFLLLIIIGYSSKNISKINKEIAQETKPNTTSNIPTSIVAPSSIPSPSPTPTKIPLSNPTSTPVIIQSSNSQDLLIAVNTFRSKNGLGQLSSNNSLCSIAQSRVRENATLGQLDNHAGFDKYFKGQTEFKSMGENLHWATYSETAAEIVENGWADSPGHRVNMLDFKWQYGCGEQKGSYFASFIFASK